MSNPFRDPLLTLLDKRNSVDDRIRKEVTPVLREFNRLTSILLKHALTTGNLGLHDWLNGIKAEFGRRDQLISEQLSELEVAEMNIRPSNQSEEEVLKFIKHADELAALNLRRLELHADFIREQNQVLRAKIVELGLKTDS